MTVGFILYSSQENSVLSYQVAKLMEMLCLPIIVIVVIVYLY